MGQGKSLKSERKNSNYELCTPREGNSGHILLTSRNRLKHFYQCTLTYLINKPARLTIFGIMNLMIKMCFDVNQQIAKFFLLAK